MITYEDFEKVDIRVGKIIEAQPLKDGKYSTHKLVIDFGKELGTKKSSARLIGYEVKDLKGKLVLGVVNFPPRQIGASVSEVLTLGVPNQDGDSCILISPDQPAVLGAKLY